MKKDTRNKFIAIFFGLLMLGSTATYALMQAYNFFGTPQQNQAAQLPSSNIVQEKLSDAVELLIMSKKATVVQFYYSSNCLECVRQRNVLESYVQNNGQIYLEEIQTSNPVAQNIIIKSLLDQKTLSNANESDIQNAFCDVLVYPPAQCALRSLNTS